MLRFIICVLVVILDFVIMIPIEIVGFIIGLFSGVMGIGISLLMLFPINAIIHVIAENDNVNAFLPVTNALILIVLSILLTLIGGIIPSRKAAKKDPVTALRTE